MPPGPLADGPEPVYRDGTDQEATMAYPELSCTAIDARDPRALAEFYRELLGLPRPA